MFSEIIWPKGVSILRRKDREVVSEAWMEEVLSEGEWLVLSMEGRDGWPYSVPLNYGYRGGELFFHGAREGAKIELLRENPKVFFTVVAGTELIRKSEPASFSMKYKSVAGTGIAEFIEDADEKREALRVLMRQFDGPTEPLPDKIVAVTAVFKVKILSMTGKTNGYPRPEGL
jgi:nitroimidazol reductase NimA-like FMN-containing flavoprotein (pyridoxamine 5'-phosphate oxidase superfamily)